MSDKKKNHNNTFRAMLSWAGKLFVLFMVSLLVLFSLALIWIAYLVYKDGYGGWAFLLLLAGIVLFVYGALLFKMALRMPRIRYGLEFKEDGIYQYFIDFDQQETIERFVLYDQIKRLYVGPAAVKIHKQPYYYIAVRIVWEWSENGEKAYASAIAETEGQLVETMKRFSGEIPIHATEYNINHFPDIGLPVVLASSELTEIKERDPLVLPFPAFRRQFSSGKEWEPPEEKAKRERKYEKLNRIGTFFFRLSLVYCFLYCLIFLPGWHMTDEQVIDDDMMVIFPIPLLLPLMIFFYMRKQLIIKRVMKLNLCLLATYVLGALVGTLLTGSGIIFFITALEYGTYLAITLVITFIATKIIWWFFYMFFFMFQMLIRENFKGQQGTFQRTSKAESK